MTKLNGRIGRVMYFFDRSLEMPPLTLSVNNERSLKHWRIFQVILRNLIISSSLVTKMIWLIICLCISVFFIRLYPQ